MLYRTVSELSHSIGEIFAFDWGLLYLMHFFSISCKTITINHIFSKTIFVGLHLLLRRYGFIFNRFNEIGPKSAESGKRKHCLWFPILVWHANKLYQLIRRRPWTGVAVAVIITRMLEALCYYD